MKTEWKVSSFVIVYRLIIKSSEQLSHKDEAAKIFAW
jgi:hypothetical protein